MSDFPIGTVVRLTCKGRLWGTVGVIAPYSDLPTGGPYRAVKLDTVPSSTVVVHPRDMLPVESPNA